MPKKADSLKGSADETAEGEAKSVSLQDKDKALKETRGRASDNPIADMLDEGRTVGHPGGQLRGDQTEGHRGGDQRQTHNRGRD